MGSSQSQNHFYETFEPQLVCKQDVIDHCDDMLSELQNTYVERPLAKGSVGVFDESECENDDENELDAEVREYEEIVDAQKDALDACISARVTISENSRQAPYYYHQCYSAYKEWKEAMS